MKNLADLVTELNIDIEPDQQWSVLGLEAQGIEPVLLRAKARICAFDREHVSKLDGVLLFGALSAEHNPLDYLAQVTEPLAEGATVLIVDWQTDGPLNVGPALERRFRKGRARRQLRETGFGIVEVLDEHPLYYVIKGVKSPAPPVPHANEYVDVAGLSELSRNAMKLVQLFGQDIVIANTGKEIVAFARVCPHANGPLEKGLLRGCNVVCPLHAYIWNVCSGQPVEPADEDTLPRYSVKIDATNNRVLVSLAPP